RARRHVLASALAEPVGASAHAAVLERLAISHASLDEPEQEADEIRTVDLDVIRSVAVRDLVPERMITVVRGPEREVASAFDALGIPRAAIQPLPVPKRAK